MEVLFRRISRLIDKPRNWDQNEGWACLVRTEFLPPNIDSVTNAASRTVQAGAAVANAAQPWNNV